VAKKIVKQVPKADEKRGRGRPTKYTDGLAAEICLWVADGGTMAAFCRQEDKPDRETVRRWSREREDFRGNLQRAREEQADSLVDEGLEAVRAAWDRDTAAAAKVKVDAMFKLAGWRRPAAYGSKVKHEHAGEGGGSIKVEFDYAGYASRFEQYARQRLCVGGDGHPPANGN
jgi:hypothetical protein